MAKKKEPEKQGNEELFLALNLLEKEKGIPVEFMLDKIKKAISTACKNNYGNEDVDIDVDPEKGVFNVYPVSYTHLTTERTAFRIVSSVSVSLLFARLSGEKLENRWNLGPSWTLVL